MPVIIDVEMDIDNKTEDVEVEIDNKTEIKPDFGEVMKVTEYGHSAYDLAVKNGFVGTEQEWVESLRGEDGKDGAKGADGQNGKDGANGKSAYQIAVENGFVGTEQEWVEKLSTQNGFEMPQIRFTSISGDIHSIHDGTTIHFNVEIIGGGELQIGDTLELCEMITYSHRIKGIEKGRRLRRLFSYEIDENHIDWKFLSLPFHFSYNNWKACRIYRTGDCSCHSTYSPLYLRIRRQTYNKKGIAANAKFSNVVTVWKNICNADGGAFSLHYRH